MNLRCCVASEVNEPDYPWQSEGRCFRPHTRLDVRAAAIAVAICSAVAGSGSARPEGTPRRPLILAHYMSWFVAKPASPVWGWHWTMGGFDPEKVQGGNRAIASHYAPLIGPYDSGDPAVAEYHFLLMKMAGIDGIIVDWYGLSHLFDYPVIHRNTAALFPAAARLGLKIGICYEDRTIPRLVDAGKLAKRDRVTHARAEIVWLRNNWFVEPSYLRIDGRPVLLSFGSGGLTDAEWQEVLSKDADAPTYLSEHRRRPGAAGAFDWPVPKEGLAGLDRFADAAKAWPIRMPAAFPRFHDIYAEAKVHESYGAIPDDRGRTFTTSLRRALTGGAPLVQIVTWNDWGEGTIVEPSVEYGYRDLEAMQRLRREHLEPGFSPTPDDLRLAHRLYLLRRARASRPGQDQELDEVARLLALGRFRSARKTLSGFATTGR